MQTGATTVQTRIMPTLLGLADNGTMGFRGHLRLVS